MARYLVMQDSKYSTESAARLRSAQIAVAQGCGPGTRYWFDVASVSGKSSLIVRDGWEVALTSAEQAALSDTLDWSAVYAPLTYTGPSATGTLGQQPFDLQTAVASLEPGGTLELPHGIYQVSGTLQFGPAGLSPEQRTTIRAAAGARPLIVDSTYGGPRVAHSANMVIDGLWFGGVRLGTEYAITMADHVTLQGCVFFGYKQCIAEGAATRTQYIGNLFVHNGLHPHYHDVYVSNSAAANSGEAAYISGNVIIGGEGYGLHFYHQPQYGQALNNFIAKDYALSSWSAGATFADNIIWRGWHNIGGNYAQDGADIHIGRTFRGNVYGPYAALMADFHEADTVDANAFVNQATVGRNAIRWSAREVMQRLSATAAEIDAAAAQLERAFSQDVAAIHADTTIEDNFSTLAGVLNTWQQVTPTRMGSHRRAS